MVHPRIRRHAEILVDRCTQAKQGDTVLIWAYSELAKPLVVEVYRLLLHRGSAEIISQIEFEEMREVLMAESPEERLGLYPSLRMHAMQHADVCIRIMAPGNTRLLSGIPPARISRWRASEAPLYAWLWDNTRWVVTLYPTIAAAQDAEMSFRDFEDFVYSAVDQDWDLLAREQRELKELFDRGREVVIKGEDTDIRMRVAGRTFLSADGDNNMPDGEIFTGPVEDSIEGHILFTYPAIYPAEGGKQVECVHLWFEQGRVVEASATTGQEYLMSMLDMDGGSRYVGELGLGNNRKIDRFIENILFDEKIGGTVHLALGRGWPATGSKNDSALHWDMIKDLRRGGEIYLDGTLVQKDGQWVY